MDAPDKRHGASGAAQRLGAAERRIGFHHVEYLPGGDTDERVFMWAFDLIELNDDDLWRDPLEVRKETLTLMLSRTGASIRLNEHLEHEDEGALVFYHALISYRLARRPARHGVAYALAA